MSAKSKRKPAEDPVRFSKFDASPYLTNQSVVIDHPGAYGDSLLYPTQPREEAKIPRRVGKRGSPFRDYSDSPYRYGHDFCKE